MAEEVEIPFERIFFKKDSMRPRQLKKDEQVQVAWKHDAESPLAWWGATVVKDFDIKADKKVDLVYNYDMSDWKRDVCTVNIKYVRILPTYVAFSQNLKK